MSFMDLFVPMFFAFIAASVVMALSHFLLSLWISKRHATKVKNYYKDIAEKMGMSPEDFISQMENQMNNMDGMGMLNGPPGMMGGPMENVMTTTSGDGEVHEHGNYL
ncbi:hypothetical protein LCGC14_1133600 [marine sediment metagenome]|uniref:Uncharacterized protein n=1 Tax=marine sediment metagenome TaxID=412755 RepID=A0A0F9MNA8_9ZZZZ